MRPERFLEQDTGRFGPWRDARQLRTEAVDRVHQIRGGYSSKRRRFVLDGMTGTAKKIALFATYKYCSIGASPTVT